MARGRFFSLFLHLTENRKWKDQKDCTRPFPVKERQIEVEPRIKRPLANASVRFFCFSFLEK
ncbi:MAG: hypothetical protein E7152_04985 [Enterococcus casseliflavus]|nr:hypothetical protein [Enterococcus casseliflavus]